jgi:hypothetical protein
MKLFFTLLILAPVSIFPQNMEQLFRTYIPEVLKNDNENYSQVLETLKRDAFLNPELLYYRINYYELRFNKGEMDNTKNGFEKIRSLVSQAIDKRNNWVDEQILKVRSYKKRSDFVADINQYFESLKSDIIVDNTFSIEMEQSAQHRVNFFICLYLSGNPDLKYEEITDYVKLRKNLEENKQNELMNLYSDLRNETSTISETELRGLVIKLWYLFPIGSEEENYVDAYEIMLTQLESEYSIEKIDRFIFLAGIRYYFLNEISQFKIYPEEISEGVQIAEVYNKFGLTAQVGYRFLLSNSYSILSYINANLNFSIGTNSEITQSDSIIYSRSNISGNDFTSQYWVLDQPEVSDRVITSIYLRTSTPVFIIGKIFSLELGFMMGFSHLTYDVKYSYEYSKVRVDWDEQNGGYHNTLLARYTVEDREETESQTNFRIYPTVDINFQLIKPLIFQISTGYNLVEVKAGMTF